MARDRGSIFTEFRISKILTVKLQKRDANLSRSFGQFRATFSRKVEKY
jgi:hypothetical protein